MNRTLIIGDCHIGAGTSIGRVGSGTSLNSRILDQMNVLQWILQTGISRDINRFIFTGDIFEDLKPDQNLLVMFLDWLRSCSDYGIECDIIAGNHDLKRVGNKYSSILDIIQSADIPGIFVYNHFYTLHTSGVSFTLVPFRDRRSVGADSCDEAIDKVMSKLTYELAGIPSENDKVCIGHLAMEKSFYTDEVDDVSNELMIPYHWFDGYDYVWMGHVHMPQVMQKSSPLIEHVGSMDISNFGETNQTKIVVLYDPDSKGKFEKIDVPSRPLRRIRVEVPVDENPTQYVLNKIEEIEDDKSFKRSIVKGEVKILNPNADGLDRDLIFDRLKDLGIYHISNFSESKAAVVVAASKMHIKDSAIKPKEAVKSISEVIDHESDEEKEEFSLLCKEVIDEYEATKK